MHFRVLDKYIFVFEEFFASVALVHRRCVRNCFFFPEENTRQLRDLASFESYSQIVQYQRLVGVLFFEAHQRSEINEGVLGTIYYYIGFRN